jgi:hypothetical protein
MTLYYAPGGGLGHTTRAQRVLDRLGIDDAVVIGSADLPPSLEGDVDAHRDWLRSRIDARLIVDTFPAGIQGELAGIEAPRIDHVARLLRWDEYRRVVPNEGPRFATTYTVEALTAEHEAYLRERSDTFVMLELQAPAAAAAPVAGRWLVVHSGPAAEVQELVAYARELASVWAPPARRCIVNSAAEPAAATQNPRYARDFASVWAPPTRRCSADSAAESAAATQNPRYARELASVWAPPTRRCIVNSAAGSAAATQKQILVATRCDVDLPAGVTRIDAHPATHLYPTAEGIVTAAGFNVMLETEPYRERHHVIPFPRRFDDQFLRAARRRDATARIG